MNIYAKPGTKVRATIKHGLDHHKALIREFLKVGEIYTVLRTEVHSFRTGVFLEECPNVEFNSVNFEDVEVEKDAADYPKDHRDFTIRELQDQLPWTIHYAKAFRESGLPHKDYQHALIHVMKAAGKIAAIVNDAEHAGGDFALARPYVADLVICALRMANTSPEGEFDLQAEVENRIESKNQMKLKRREPCQS